MSLIREKAAIRVNDDRIDQLCPNSNIKEDYHQFINCIQISINNTIEIIIILQDVPRKFDEEINQAVNKLN